MGLSFAKSVKFGAVRFNFSGGGIGVSVGVPGLRIGTGPRGAYIGGGMGGFRYRKSLGTNSPPSRVPDQQRITQPSSPGQGTISSMDANVVATGLRTVASCLCANTTNCTYRHPAGLTSVLWGPVTVVLTRLRRLLPLFEISGNLIHTFGSGVGSEWPSNYGNRRLPSQHLESIAVH